MRTRNQARAAIGLAGDEQPMTPLVDERRFQDRVERLARFYGWTPYHTYDSRRSAKGFPDLAMYRHADQHGETYPLMSEALYREMTGDRVTPALGEQRLIPHPDCEVVFAELKVGKRKLTPEQAAWLEALRAAGIEAYEWRYPDSVRDLCERLARGRHRVDPEWAVEAEIARRGLE